MAAWAWIPIVVWAAFSQTVRNAAQRKLTAELGTLTATLVRFLYGLPFAALWLLLVCHFRPGEASVPAFNPGYAFWLAVGALAQLAATALLLLAMRERNFIVAVVYSKTEVLQVALFASVFLRELPGLWSLVAIVLASAGVVMLSLPKPGAAAEPRAKGTGWMGGPAVAYGLGCGACFALSSVGYRGAALALPESSAWIIGAWNVLCAQTLQSLLLGSYLAVTARDSLAAMLRSWRLSTVAGTMGSLASIGWLTAMSMRPAADVRTLGLVEVLFSLVVSRQLFREKMRGTEFIGLLLILAGVLTVSAQM